MTEIELVGMEGAASCLDIKEKTLRKRYKGWGIPSRKIGRLVRFDRKELAAWLETRRQTPTAAVSPAQIGPEGRKAS